MIPPSPYGCRCQEQERKLLALQESSDLKPAAEVQMLAARVTQLEGTLSQTQARLAPVELQVLFCTLSS